MFKYSVKLILRQIAKGDRQLLLNLLGLSVAFAAVLFLSTFFITELNKGKSLEDYENIYRITAKEGDYWSSRSLKEFENKFPEVKSITKLHNNWSDKSYYEVDKRSVKAGKIIIADEHFFEVFQYRVLVGDLKQALMLKENIVLTKKEALKIFGNIDVVGRKLQFMTTSFGKMDLTVAAVIEDQSLEAMLNFDAIVPVLVIESNVAWYKSDHWGQSNFEAFALLHPNSSTAHLEEELNATFKASAPDWAIKDKGDIYLKAYSNLYFSGSANSVLSHSNLKRVKTLGAVMVVIFLLALINFINLNTAQKIKQARNIGIHKAMGASIWNSFNRIIAEIFPVLLIAFLIAMAMVLTALPLLNELFSSKFSISNFLSEKSVLTGLSMVLLTLVISTLFIAVYFHRYNLLLVLKNNSISKKENLRNVLLVVQFSLSIGLIISALFIYKQNNFLQHHSVGFKNDNIVYLPLIDEMSLQKEALKQALLDIAEVSATTMASHPLGKADMGWGMSLNNNGEEKRIAYEAMLIDKDFFDFFGIRIIEGENFRPSSIREKEHIFNETAIKTYGIENIKNARISSYDGATGEIIGVVKDFNFESLHHAISPIGFICRKPENLDIIYLNLQANNGKQIQKTLAEIETVWKKFANDWPFEYYFLDQTLDSLYKEDLMFSKIFLLATILSVFIGCLGLLSTAIFVAELRIKEVGIRKVNGAKISEVLIMLNKDFVKWVVIAFAIATPVAWYAMHRWLENFAYKTSLSWWIFALAGLLALGIALLTVSWQSWRAATRNPVEALRYE
jgi:putative ABC transport system permease protein